MPEEQASAPQNPALSAPRPAASRAAVAETNKAEVRGVFSTQEIRRVGTGTTTRKTVQKTFWFIEQHGDVIECQPLNPNYVPSGPKRKITMDELISKFAPEPEFYLNSVYPKMQELQRSVDNGDNHREKGENFAAEYEYSRALKVDEENVRANFGIGLTYMERGDAERPRIFSSAWSSWTARSSPSTSIFSMNSALICARTRCCNSPWSITSAPCNSRRAMKTCT